MGANLATTQTDGGRHHPVPRVLSVLLAAIGGSFSLAMVLLLNIAAGLAAEGGPVVWSTSDLVYTWGYGLVGVVVLCGAWVLWWRPWAGVLIMLAAAALLFLDVALLHITTFRAHLDLWAVVAVPLLLAAGLGTWRALADGRSSGSRHE